MTLTVADLLERVSDLAETAERQCFDLNSISDIERVHRRLDVLIEAVQYLTSAVKNLAGSE